MQNASFEKIVLTGSKFTECNLKDIEITECETDGLKIDGIDIGAVIKAIKEKKIDVDKLING